MRTALSIPLVAMSLAIASPGCEPSLPTSPPRSPEATGGPGAVALEAKPRAGALGRLDFPVTGSPRCRERFAEGMLALHSFLYDQAHEIFAAALDASKTDGPCAM